MRSTGGKIDYTTQLGTKVTDRTSFDQTVPYTICSNYNGYSTGTDTISHKLCLIESPGYYTIGDAETKVLLAKNVTVALNDCFVDIVPTTTSSDTKVTISLYVGTTDDVVDNTTVYLYHYISNVPKDQHFRINIPDISNFVVPSGKNIILAVDSNGACYVDGHFVSSIDD